MIAPGKKKIVLLGMMTRIPVAGAIWGTMQYLLGFRRLGYDVYYVEAHARTPTMLMRRKDDDATSLAASFLDRILRRFDLHDKWAFHALHDNGRCYGMTQGQLQQLYRDAALIINYHGSTVPLPEHSATGRLIYLETDPVQLEIELHHQDEQALAFIKPHVAFFTWGLNYNHPDCRVPLPKEFHFRPMCPPVLPDLWRPFANEPAEVFTTIGNWRQGGEVTYQGEVYTWSKHHEFLKFLDLPRRTSQVFELGLSSSSYDEDDKRLLLEHGWRLRDTLAFLDDLDAYRRYLTSSRSEFTVAKDQNIRLRSGWFSERSAQYLAAGRPVITQETGFSNALPTGRGLFAFSRMEDILGAVDRINGDYERHRRAAYSLAREYFDSDLVLRRLLNEMGV
jgi:hypothetical protein